MAIAEVGKNYQHYKGNNYIVIAIGRHTETNEELVVYKDTNNVWIRPKDMWEEKVLINEKLVERFTLET